MPWNETEGRRERASRPRRPKVTQSTQGEGNGAAQPEQTGSAQGASPQVPPARTNGTCADANLTPTASNGPEVTGATLCLINEVRRQSGLSPLKENASLDHAAQAFSDAMVSENFFSDTSPQGANLGTRVLETTYVPAGEGYLLGENIGYGTGELATPAEMVAAWMASPPHRANILNPRFEETGIGVDAAAPASYANGRPGATYTQDFGTILN